MNSKIKLARSISTLTNPPIICIPLFLIICLSLSVNNLWDFPLLELVSLVFTTILPLAIILYWAEKSNNDKDISNREDRQVPLIIGTVSYFLGYILSSYLGLNEFLICLLLCYSINTFIVMLITRKWKISIHTTGLSGPVCALIILLGSIGAIFGLLYPIIIWARITLKKHTMSQAIIGGIFGFVFTAVEIFTFIYVFNLNVGNIYPFLEVCGLILAIVITPTILWLLSRFEIKNPLIFYLIEIIVFCFFLAITPITTTLIYVLTSMVSIYIANMGGVKFKWYGVIR